MSYDVADLPVWRTKGNGQPTFDPSVLIAHIKHSVDPESWERRGGPAIRQYDDNLSIVISQTEANHRQVRVLLEELRKTSP